MDNILEQVNLLVLDCIRYIADHDIDKDDTIDMGNRIQIDMDNRIKIIHETLAPLMDHVCGISPTCFGSNNKLKNITEENELLRFLCLRKNICCCNARGMISISSDERRIAREMLNKYSYSEHPVKSA